MKKNSIIFVVGIVVLFGVVWYALSRTLYGPRDPLTKEILTAQPWSVEANGEYNGIEFVSGSSVNVLVDNDISDTGSWEFDGSRLSLDFDANTHDRVYTMMHFDKHGILVSLTEGNQERWHPIIEQE